MAIKLYNDVVNLIEDSKAEIQAIFPNGKIVQKNAEQMFIQLQTKYNTGYKSAYFRGIDGNMAGVLEASWLLYCDDLIKNIEEAMNPDRMETARTKYGTDIVQRKANKEVRELHIATRWSTGDVISTLENEHKGSEKWKFLKKPALDENGKSNFMYEHPFEMDEEYFLERRNSPMMDEISFSCIYQQEPIEREGLWVTEDGLHYFNGELPDIECDLVCGACDVAWGGGDYLSMPIAKVYGKAVYIVDVVYNNKTKEVTRPIVVGQIKNNKIEKIIFEANDGKQFDNENDCEAYEGALLHPNLFSITFYNMSGDSYRIQRHNIFSDDVYNTCEVIDVHNEKEVDDLAWLVEQTGWVELEDITSPGTWVRKDLGLGDAEWIKEE